MDQEVMGRVLTEHEAVWSCCGQVYDVRAVAIYDHCTRCHLMFSQGFDSCPNCPDEVPDA